MKTISFIFTGPPTANIGSFVGVVDSDGNDVIVGWWEHDGVAWRYVCPVELVPRLMGAAGLPEMKQIPIQQMAGAVVKEMESMSSLTPINEGVSARQALKEKLKNATKRSTTPVVETATEVPAHWERCPSCSKSFDPAKDELLDCGTCGESKCTAACLPDPTKKCLDCAALVAGPDDGGFDAAATPPSVFQPGFATAESIAQKTGAAADTDSEDES